MRKSANARPEVVIAIPTIGKTYRSLLAGILRYVRNATGWTCRFTTGRGDDPALEDLLGKNTFCLIIEDEWAERSADLIEASGVPVIAMQSSALPRRTVAVIGTDHDNVGRLAAEHFIAEGFSSFAYVGDLHDRWWWSKDRCKSFARHLSGHGQTCAVYPGGDLGAWLRTLPRPTAVLAANDNRARTVLQTCREAGIDVPSDIALLGVDDDELLCSTASPPLSSIGWNTEKIGFTVAAYVDRAVKSGHFPRTKRIFAYAGTHLTVRASSRRLKVRDKMIERCLDYIGEHFAEPLTTDSIARALGVYRRTLEKHFMSATGTSIHREIVARRLALARTLLAERNLSAEAIAERCGFFDASHMRRALKNSADAKAAS